MGTLKAKIIGSWAMASLLIPGIAWAGGGGEVAPIVIVADSRRLSSLMAWWANLYNESHLYFMILTVVIIPLIGVMFGLVADIIMKRIGIDLKSRELAEH